MRKLTSVNAEYIKFNDRHNTGRKVRSEMIEKVRGIRIHGRCFKDETDLMFYPKENDRIAIVYGKNGSGKSTISEGIASIAEGGSSTDLSTEFVDSNSNVLPLEDGADVFVFNEKYIDENVKIDDAGLSTIVLLGGQVNLQADIEAQEKTVEASRSKVEAAELEFQKYQDKNNPLCPDYHYKRISDMLKKDGGWAEIDSQIKDKKIKSSVTDSTIREIGSLSVHETLDELKRAFAEKRLLLEKVSDSSVSYPNRFGPIVFDPGVEASLISILSRKIEEPIISEREKLILDAVQNGLQNMVELSREVFSKDNTELCPYCYQPVTEQYKHDLVDSINRVLNKEVDEHKDELYSFAFPRIAVELEPAESLDPELCNKARRQLDECNKILSQYQELLTQKSGNIYTPIIIQPKGLIEAIDKMNQILSKLEERRAEFNSAAKQRAAIIRDLLSINKSIAHIEIAQAYKDLIKQEKEKNNLQKSIDQLNNIFHLESDKLMILEQRLADIGLAIENINNSLDYVFMSHGRLSIELRNEKYYLKSNGEDVLPKKVSQGERNIIALCYFFTQIFANREIGKLYQNETIIVLDDPVSSFDIENKVGIFSFIRYQARQIIMGNGKSKLLFLSHDLETVFALEKAMDEICKSTKGIANVAKCQKNSFELHSLRVNQLTGHSEYGDLLKNIYRFASGKDSGEALVIGNEMRRALEAFSSFSFQKNIEQVSLDKNVLAALGDRSDFFESLMYRLVLHGESHFKEQIYSIHDGYNFHQFISRDEKQKTAKYILCFMYLLNPCHIKAYFHDDEDAVRRINAWARDIPGNDAFAITVHSKKRIVPLYTLPLSAGIGNESLDDIPSDDYETDNESCDFALKVSGDSMEPKIPDGSVVLIQKADTLDDGEVGAIYLNGKMYCKYIHHEKGVTLLCSFNDAYSPIPVMADDVLKVFGKVVIVC